MGNFLLNNQHYFVLIIALGCVAILVVAFLIYNKSAKLNRSLLVNKFKVLDMNEKNTSDNAPLYTVIISNNSMNTVSIASLGFEHNGDYFNYRAECKTQLDSKNRDLVILPRGSIKLRLFKETLESAVFETVKSKRLKRVRVYLVGLGGENFIASTKVIGKKMKESYKEYYIYHKSEVVAKFVASCKHKLDSGVKLRLIEKLKFKLWSKSVTSPLPEIKSPKERYNLTGSEIPAECAVTSDAALQSCDMVDPDIPVVNEVYESKPSVLNSDGNEVQVEAASSKKNLD